MEKTTCITTDIFVYNGDSNQIDKYQVAIDVEKLAFVNEEIKSSCHWLKARESYQSTSAKSFPPSALERESKFIKEGEHGPVYENSYCLEVKPGRSEVIEKLIAGDMSQLKKLFLSDAELNKEFIFDDECRDKVLSTEDFMDMIVKTLSIEFIDSIDYSTYQKANEFTGTNPENNKSYVLGKRNGAAISRSTLSEYLKY